MAYQFYVTIKGQKQGKFKGGSNQPSHPGASIAFTYEQQIVSPRDIGTGQSSGKRQHKPITIIKAWDAASPQLFLACVTNETLSEVLLEFPRANANGTVSIAHTLRLTNASVSNLRQFVADPVMAAEYDTADLEEVSFTYQKIEMTDRIGKTSAADDWHV